MGLKPACIILENTFSLLAWDAVHKYLSSWPNNHFPHGNLRELRERRLWGVLPMSDLMNTTMSEHLGKLVKRELRPRSGNP